MDIKLWFILNEEYHSQDVVWLVWFSLFVAFTGSLTYVPTPRRWECCPEVELTELSPNKGSQPYGKENASLPSYYSPLISCQHIGMEQAVPAFAGPKPCVYVYKFIQKKNKGT